MKIFFSVGEPSGDLHAANLIRAIRARRPDARAVGYGGPKMAAAGSIIKASGIPTIQNASDNTTDLSRLGVANMFRISNTAKIWMPWKFSIGDWSAVGEEVWIYNLGNVTVGARVTISQKAHLCAGTHDHEDPAMPLLKLPIRIGDQVWICADAFIGPGVVVGEGAVVGAAAVAMADVPPWSVVAGNPAKFIKKRMLRN